MMVQATSPHGDHSNSPKWPQVPPSRFSFLKSSSLFAGMAFTHCMQLSFRSLFCASTSARGCRAGTRHSQQCPTQHSPYLPTCTLASVKCQAVFSYGKPHPHGFSWVVPLPTAPHSYPRLQHSQSQFQVTIIPVKRLIGSTLARSSLLLNRLIF